MTYTDRHYPIRLSNTFNRQKTSLNKYVAQRIFESENVVLARVKLLAGSLNSPAGAVKHNIAFPKVAPYNKVSE